MRIQQGTGKHVERNLEHAVIRNLIQIFVDINYVWSRTQGHKEGKQVNEVQGDFRRVTDVESGQKFWINLRQVETVSVDNNEYTQLAFPSGTIEVVRESISLLLDPPVYVRIHETTSDDIVAIGYYYERCNHTGIVVVTNSASGLYATKDQAIKQAHEDGFWVVNA